MATAASYRRKSLFHVGCPHSVLKVNPRHAECEHLLTLTPTGSSQLPFTSRLLFRLVCASFESEVLAGLTISGSVMDVYERDLLRGEGLVQGRRQLVGSVRDSPPPMDLTISW